MMIIQQLQKNTNIKHLFHGKEHVVKLKSIYKVSLYINIQLYSSMRLEGMLTLFAKELGSSLNEEQQIGLLACSLARPG